MSNSSTKRALILGVTGQDGSYLAELLLSKGYAVHGLVRRSATSNTANIDHLLNDGALADRFRVWRGDLADPVSLQRIVAAVAPNEIYNEADQDHVGWSHEVPGYSADITGAAVGRLLEIVRAVDRSIRVFQPCTSNMFGPTADGVQDERTELRPASPYACAKAYAYHLSRHYRDAYGMFVSTAIMFNHESPRRSADYVTRKITKGVAAIAAGKQQEIVLGSLEAQIDWGYAPEYVEAAWNILQLDMPDDFVLATGETHSVGEWAEEACRIAGLDPDERIRTSAALKRPVESRAMRGNSAKARDRFGFAPRMTFKPLVRLMTEHDLAATA